MRGPLLALSFVSLSLAWLVFSGAGVWQPDWYAALLFLGATALFYWTFRSGQTPPRLPRWHSLALWALPIFAVFQLLPLPPAMLDSLSPARALIADSLGGIIPNLTHAPISVAPAAAMAGLFGLLGYLTGFSLLRDISWRIIERRPWLPIAPLALIAAVEASIAIGQWIAGTPDTPVRGTLSSPEHLAALLEIALPFTLVFGFISFRRYQLQTAPPSAAAIRAAASWSASLLLLLALFLSSSRASHAAIIVSLYILLAFAVVPRLRTRNLRWCGAGVAALIALAVCLVIVPPPDLPEALAELGATDKSPAEARLILWNNSAELFAEFPWFGVGIGGFPSTFPKYQGSADLTRIETPHNDVLALLVNFGIAGSCIVLVVLAGIIRPAVMGSVFLAEEPRRLLAASVIASLAAVLVRACMESTLSSPVIAMSFAWLAGVSQSSGLD